MHREGHIGAALVGYAPLAFVTTLVGFPEVAVLGGIVAVGLAMVPDYDQRVPGIDHRGITHTVWFALAVGVILGIGAALGSPRESSLAIAALGLFGFLVGSITIVSHVAADALTPMGVQPLSPVDDRHVSYDLATASNPLANYALLAVGVVAAGCAAALGIVLGGM